MDFRINFSQILSNLAHSFQDRGLWVYHRGNELRMRCVTQLPPFLRSWKIAVVGAGGLALLAYYFLHKRGPGRGDNGGSKQPDQITATVTDDVPPKIVKVNVEPSPATGGANPACFNIPITSNAVQIPGEIGRKLTPPPATPSISRPATPSPIDASPQVPSNPPQPASSNSSASTPSRLEDSFVIVDEDLDMGDTEEKQQSWFEQILYKYFFSQFSEAKLMKYHHIIPQIINQAEPVPDQFPNSTNEETAIWNELLKIMQKTPSLVDARVHYRTFVDTLERAAELFRKNKNDPRYRYISSLCYHRYKSVQLFPYAEELILYLTNRRPFPELSLKNFMEELENRGEEIKQMADKENVPKLQLIMKKLKGYLNIKFNPLGEDNVPHVDGELSWNGNTVTLLRHGVPLTHDNLRKFVGQKTIVINASYEAFLDYAANQKTEGEAGEKVLSIILEDSDEKWVGDESERVKDRINIAETHPNFIPIALRLDGDFFNPPGRFTPISIVSLMGEFISKLNDPKSGYNISKVQETLTSEVLIKLLNEVRAIYFPGVVDIATREDYQAFLLLAYAHIILYLCQELKISILEAICKDDIDRGNAIKTILKLHFMRLTGQITPDNLKKTLINTVFAPLLVKKQPILGYRKALIAATIGRMLKSFTVTDTGQNALLKIHQTPVASGFYTVSKPGVQSTAPRCSSAQTVVHYKDYFSHSVGKTIPLSSENLIKKFSKAPNLLREGIIKAELLRTQIKTAAESFEICLNEKIIKKNISFQLCQYLKTQGIQEQDAHKILSAIQTQPIEDAKLLLSAMFDNPSLQYSLEKAQETATLFKLEAEAGVAQLTWTVHFRIKNTDLPLIKAVIHIADHREGKATITLPKIALKK